MPDDESRDDIENQAVQENQIEPLCTSPDPPASHPAEAVTNQDVHREVEDVENRIGRAERSMIRLTAAIAFFALCSVVVGILQWNAMSGQLGEMKSGSTQTDRLISAATGIAGSIAESIHKADAARESSEIQSKRALDVSIAASRIDQRAWFGIKEITLANPLVIGKSVQISIIGLNTGKTPTLDLSLTEVRVGPSETDTSRDFIFSIPDREVVAPNNTDVFYATVKYSDDSIKAIMAATIRIYIHGILEYRDVFGSPHRTTFCAYYPTDGPDSAVGHFFNCRTGNSMN